MSHWLDRVSASDLLGVSVTTICNWEREGKLHPKRELRRAIDNQDRWVIVYDPQELAKMPRRTKVESRMRSLGEITALAFELFRQGVSLDVVAIEIRQDPDTVISLHERWLDMSRARYVISPDAWVLFENVVGKFDDVLALLERVRAQAAELEKLRPKIADADPLPPAERAHPDADLNAITEPKLIHEP